jgi:hypothetical protein
MFNPADASEGAATQINVMLNWSVELKPRAAREK